MQAPSKTRSTRTRGRNKQENKASIKLQEKKKEKTDRAPFKSPAKLRTGIQNSTIQTPDKQLLEIHNIRKSTKNGKQTQKSFTALYY